MALFTVESATLAGRLSGTVRQLKKEREANGHGKPRLDAETAWELKIVEEQLARARKALNDDKEFFCPACERCGMAPSHRAQLMKSLDTFLDRRRELLGRPRLATLKPSTKPPRREVSDPQPTPTRHIEPTPAISQAEAPSVSAPIQAISGDWSTTLF